MTKKLLANSFIFFAGTIVLSVFNYLYNSMMGRFLGPADYSVLGALLAFISIITLPTNAISTVAMHFSAHYHAKNEDPKIKGFLLKLTRNLGALGIVIAIFIAALSGPIANFLHLPSRTPVLIIAPVLIFFILLPLNRGILQGLQNFTQAILNQNIDPLLKLLLGLLLVKLGLGVNGALLALFVSSLIGYLASYLPLRSILQTNASPMVKIPKDIGKYSVVALIAFLLATVLMNVDILLVKHLLEPYQAGLYTALSTVGKIVLFVTTPVVSVMFPMISDLKGREEKHYHILAQSFILTTLIGALCLSFYYLFPQLVVKILYGSQYLSIASLLGFFGVTMLLYSLINLWVNYYLSIGNNFFVVFLAVSVVTEIAMLFNHHDSFAAIIQSLLVAMIIGFTGLTSYYFYLKRNRVADLVSHNFSFGESK